MGNPDYEKTCANCGIRLGNHYSNSVPPHQSYDCPMPDGTRANPHRGYWKARSDSYYKNLSDCKEGDKVRFLNEYPGTRATVVKIWARSGTLKEFILGWKQGDADPSCPASRTSEFQESRPYLEKYQCAYGLSFTNTIKYMVELIPDTTTVSKTTNDPLYDFFAKPPAGCCPCGIPIATGCTYHPKQK